MINRVILFLGIIILVCSCVNIQSTAVNEAKWLGNRHHDEDIYLKPQSEEIIIPFNLDVDNFGIGYIQRIFLIAIEEPEFYRTIELQEIVNGKKKSAVVILYTPNDTLSEVIHLPGLDLREDQYSAILNNVRISEQLFLYKFNVDYHGAYVYLKMKDYYGRPIELELSENRLKQPDYAMLAPIGSMSKDPNFFPFIYLMEFGFVKNDSTTNINLKIDEKIQKIEKMPVKIEDEEVYNAKYSDKSVITNWMVEGSREIKPINVTELTYSNPPYFTEFYNNNGHYEIKSFSGIYDESDVRFRFSPPFPDILSIKEGEEIEGNFSASIDEYTGIFAGEYEVEKIGDKIYLEIEPKKGWQPMPGRSWVKSYQFKAEITEKDGLYFIESEWSRD